MKTLICTCKVGEFDILCPHASEFQVEEYRYQQEQREKLLKERILEE